MVKKIQVAKEVSFATGSRNGFYNLCKKQCKRCFLGFEACISRCKAIWTLVLI